MKEIGVLFFCVPFNVCVFRDLGSVDQVNTWHPCAPLSSSLVAQLQPADSRRHICLADPQGVLQHEASEQEDQEELGVFHH